MKRAIALTLALLLPAAVALADGPEAEYEHRPRHGGQFGDADDLYHYELLIDRAGKVTLFVNDERNEPLDTRALTGRWTLAPDGPQPKTGDFTPAADGAYFTAQLPPPPEGAWPVHLKVEVLKGDEWAGMEFFLPPPEE